MEPIVVKIDPDLEDLIPGFLANRGNDVVKLRELIAEGNFDDIRIIGHSMKGAGGGYGFDTITDIGGDIENAALTQDTEQLKRSVNELAEYLGRVETVLDPELS